MRDAGWTGLLIALMMAGPAVCAKGTLGGAKEENAMNAGCDKGVTIVETTVGSIGPYQVGIGNIRPREGSPGVFEATLSIRREDAAPDAPLLFRGVVAAGDRIQVEGRALVITRVDRLPARDAGPGGARSYVCLAEE